jgi:hypothetical protein
MDPPFLLPGEEPKAGKISIDAFVSSRAKERRGKYLNRILKTSCVECT